MVTLTDYRVSYGIETQEMIGAPIVGLPPDCIKAWLKFRCDDLVRLYVKTPGVITEYVPQFINGAWHVRFEDTQRVLRRLK